MFEHYAQVWFEISRVHTLYLHKNILSLADYNFDTRASTDFDNFGRIVRKQNS